MDYNPLGTSPFNSNADLTLAANIEGSSPQNLIIFFLQ